MAAAAALALWTGRGQDNFVPGLITNAAYGTAFLVSAEARKLHGLAAEQAEAGIVQEDVDFAEATDRLASRGVSLGLVGDVGRDQRDSVGGRGLVDRGLQVEAEDLGAGCGETPCGGRTEAGGPAGDQYGSA